MLTQIPDDVRLDGLLDRAFNCKSSTLKKQPLFNLISRPKGNLSVEDRLLEDCHLYLLLHHHLSFSDFSILNLAYRRKLTECDIMVLDDLLPCVIRSVRTRVNLPKRFSAIAMLAALRKENLFKYACKIVVSDSKSDSKTEERMYYRLYLSHKRHTTQWIKQAQAMAGNIFTNTNYL